MAKFLTFSIQEEREITIKVDDGDDFYPQGTPEEVGKLVEEALRDGDLCLIDLEEDLWTEDRAVKAVELKRAGTKPPKKKIW